MGDISNNSLMWLFTVILLVGFVMIYMNINGDTLTGSRYEGLIVACFGLICSVFVGVKTSNNGLEGFIGLYRFKKINYFNSTK